MKILVLGAGALGGYYGARLLEAGAEVTCLVRQTRADQLQASGLVVQSSLGNVARTVHTITRDQVTPDDDLVLLTCNTYDLDHAIAAMAPAVAEHTGILPLLNGMATYDILDQHRGTGRVLGGVASIAATLAPSGHILHLSPGDTLLIGQRAEATTALAASLYEVVSHTSGTRLLSADIAQDLWEKWVMMAAGAAMTCVMRGPISAILHTQDGRALITQAMDACAAVARLSGHALRPAAVLTRHGTLLDTASPWAASMMRDIDHQAPRLEADHLVGDLIRRAQRFGVDVPLMRIAYAHLQVYEARQHQAQGPVRPRQEAAVDHASASASAAEKRNGKENQRMDSSSDGTRGGYRVDADAPGAWRSDEIGGARPRTADQCPARTPSSAIQERAMTTERSGQGAPMSLINGARRATPDSRSDAGAPHTTSPRFDSRTRLLLEGPIVGTLLRLATPNVLVMFVQASVGLIETYFVAKLGTDALAGVALVFPVLMLMQMMSAGAMGGGISSAIARALGAGRRADADALVLHALAIAIGFGLVFMLAVLGGGPWLYGALGGSGASLAAALTYSNVVFTGAVLIWVFNSLANVIRGTGNMAVPAIVTCAGAAVLIPVSPGLIFGWGPSARRGRSTTCARFSCSSICFPSTSRGDDRQRRRPL